MLSNIIDFLNPVNTNIFENISTNIHKELMFSNIHFLNEMETVSNNKNFDIAIIGVPEDRNSKNKGTNKAPDKIRKELYNLFIPSKINIIDIGNLKKGKSVNDTYIALSEVVFELLKNELAVVIIGGSKDLIVPICKSYEKGKKTFNLCVAEPKLNLKENEDIFSEETYLSEIIENNNKLFNYTNLGYQTYYNPTENINYITKKYDTFRLGISRTKINNNEPILRDSDFFAIDISSIKKTDAPGVLKPSIHGFYGEEICQLAGYAGISDKISTFGIFNTNPVFDKENQTTELAAQIIWHFIQSFYLRKNESNPKTIKNQKKYIVNIEGLTENIIFYKSTKTQRWWFEVPYLKKEKEKIKLIACTFEDYIKASNNEIPERWWKFFKKLN